MSCASGASQLPVHRKSGRTPDCCCEAAGRLQKVNDCVFPFDHVFYLVRWVAEREGVAVRHAQAVHEQPIHGSRALARADPCDRAANVIRPSLTKESHMACVPSSSLGSASSRARPVS